MKKIINEYSCKLKRNVVRKAVYYCLLHITCVNQNNAKTLLKYSRKQIYSSPRGFEMNSRCPSATFMARMLSLAKTYTETQIQIERQKD